MKTPKLLFGIIIGAIIFSCSSDDDKANNDIIVGDWLLTKYVEVFDSGTELVYYYDCENCTEKYKTDGTIEILNVCSLYPEGCEITNDIDVEISWIKLANSEYQVNFTNYTFDTTGNTDSVSFLDDNTMRLIYNAGYDYQGMYFIYAYFEYKRKT